ncbi:hypothetical protein ACFQVC_41730, partial [Streptomyces monticola]
RLVYQARLRSRYGRNWRRKAPVESLMPLRLARYGVPLADTAPAGLAAAGIEPNLLPPAPRSAAKAELEPPHPTAPEPQPEPQPQPQPQPEPNPWFKAPPPQQVPYEGGYDPTYEPAHEPEPQHEPEPLPEPEYDSAFRVPSGPGRTRPLTIPGPRTEAGPEPEPEPEPEEAPASALPDDITREEAYFGAFRKYVSEHGDFPNARQFGIYLQDLYGVKGQSGGPLSESTLRPYVREFRGRYQEELDAEHIA